MLEQTKRISLRISSVLSKMEPEPDLYTGSDQKVTAPAPQHWIPVHYSLVKLDPLLDPDLQREKQLDPDPQKIIADPQAWKNVCMYYVQC